MFALKTPVALSLVAVLGLAACETPQLSDPDDPRARTKDSAIAGAALGGIFGRIVGDDSGDAVKGAIIGGAIGAAIGNQLDKQAAELRRDIGNGDVEVIRSGDELIVRMPQDILFAFDSDTVREGEWLKSFEIGWTPESSRFKSDRYLLTWWQKDERTEAGVPKGEGWAFTAARSINPQLNGFLRYGHSDGGGGVAARNAASIGFQYFPRKSQSLSMGLGWAEPADRSLRDEYVVEAGYKMALTPQLSVMPDIQVVIDPAENPTEDSVWLFSLRTILTF